MPVRNSDDPVDISYKTKQKRVSIEKLYLDLIINFETMQYVSISDSSKQQWKRHANILWHITKYKKSITLLN